MARKVYWLSKLKDECQLCGLSFGETMYDAGLPGGAWANICRRCFENLECQLGTGRGQEYVKQRDGRWLKTRG